jgi:uncharacterized Zn finger protein (UPF0148 family)
MSEQRIWSCDRCGFQMIEHNCKVTCPNCGARWDCSDVTIWVGDGRRGTKAGNANESRRDAGEQERGPTPGP